MIISCGTFLCFTHALLDLLFSSVGFMPAGRNPQKATLEEWVSFCWIGIQNATCYIHKNTLHHIFFAILRVGNQFTLCMFLSRTASSIPSNSLPHLSSSMRSHRPTKSSMAVNGSKMISSSLSKSANKRYGTFYWKKNMTHIMHSYCFLPHGLSSFKRFSTAKRFLMLIF